MSSLYFSFLIIFLDPQMIQESGSLKLAIFIVLVSHFFFASVYRLYHKVWEYASVEEIGVIVKAVSWSFLLASAVQYLTVSKVYIRPMLLAWMMNILLIGASRFSWRFFRHQLSHENPNIKRALIIGAGETGTSLVRHFLNTDAQNIKAIAFIDNDKNKQRLQVHGLPVYGSSQKIAQAVKELDIDQIIIAIPKLTKRELRDLLEICTETKAKTVIMPRTEDVILGKVSVSQFRDVQVEDLLGRDPIELDINSISGQIEGRTILVTGAGGSIGSEICRQVCTFLPRKIVLLGHGENSIYEINRELRGGFCDRIEIVPVIADVQDRGRLMEVMAAHRPDVVYHAAAHKHVPLMEQNPKESIKNNVIGTRNVAEAADAVGVGSFVFISTDKAVNPTNVMGSSKRMAEMVIQNLNKTSKTKFVAVRFGNVLGSRGSVIPLFKDQIHAGGPVTVTHPEMTRYFMTIPEASKLVIQAGVLARGGEIFVLDMGAPVKILDLAKNLIRLSGYTVEEIGIEFSGIRPGEKMYEELLGENEVHKNAVFPKIFIGKTVDFDYQKVAYIVDNYVMMTPVEVRNYVIDLANNRELSMQGQKV